ncbi:MAG TPA: class I SAM-dependent methyltransferase [Chthoniobacterales bacterium]
MTQSTNSPRRRNRDGIVIRGDYQALAHNSENAAQRFWHQAKLRLIERVAAPASTDRALDAGCGSGVISHFLARRCASVVGSDSNPCAIDFARQSYGGEKLQFVLGQFEDLAGSDAFDWIYSLEVIEHLYEEQVLEVLRLFKRLAKPGGHLLLTTPNYRSAWPVIEWMLDRLSLVPHLAGDQHISHFTKSKLSLACAKAGWSVIRLGTFNGFAPFLAPISYQMALRFEDWEDRWQNVLPGNLLFCVCRNDSE